MMPEDNRGDGRVAQSKWPWCREPRSRHGPPRRARGSWIARRRSTSRWWSAPRPGLRRLRRPFRWFWGRAGERLRRQPRQDRRGGAGGSGAGLPRFGDRLSATQRRRQRKSWRRRQFFRQRLPWRRHRLQQAWRQAARIALAPGARPSAARSVSPAALSVALALRQGRGETPTPLVRAIARQGPAVTAVDGRRSQPPGRRPLESVVAGLPVVGGTDRHRDATVRPGRGGMLLAAAGRPTRKTS